MKKPGGGFEWRDVTLGISNEKQVEVKDGLRSGESVILNPVSLMSEEEKRQKFGAPIRPTPPTGSRIPSKTHSQEVGARAQGFGVVRRPV